LPHLTYKTAIDDGDIFPDKLPIGVDWALATRVRLDHPPAANRFSRLLASVRSVSGAHRGIRLLVPDISLA
jgi:hypothetical protein